MPSTIGLQVPRKLLPFITKSKRYKVAYGGRGGAKSMTFADMLTMKVQTEAALVGCLREYQNSLEDSVSSLLNARIKHHRVSGFKDRKNKVIHSNGGGFRFKGLARSIDAVKSTFGYKYFWLEEGQFISEDSLKILTPTLREEGSELWISANPGSINDPFSERFINPFKEIIDKQGYYEDDDHYIVKINYRDNPWFPASLETERKLDFKMLPRALYDHIWEGEFNDSIENALIDAAWFDACVDAHIKLGFEPRGAVYASHDPSGTGSDDKTCAIRHGSVVTDVQKYETDDVNDGCDWATDLAIHNGCDVFSWDGDGLGVSLNRQVHDSFKGKKTTVIMFRGSESPDNPNALYEPVDEVHQQKQIKDAVKNKRAQYYLDLRNRVIRTYRAVIKNKYYDPDQMISFSSKITELTQLRSELCKMPIKPNGSGLFELYTKEVMKSKFKFRSPGLADGVMMTLKTPPALMDYSNMIPDPIKSIGAQRRGASYARVN